MTKSNHILVHMIATNPETEKAGLVVTFLTRIREVLGLNLAGTLATLAEPS
jgi:hypothetical protein